MNETQVKMFKELIENITNCTEALKTAVELMKENKDEEALKFMYRARIYSNKVKQVKASLSANMED